MTPDNIKEVVLYAWLGEDELGSGEVGIKAALCPAGCVPLVAIKKEKMTQEYMQEQLRAQGKAYGKTVRLCKFVFQEEILTLEP